ncbi:MAG: GGDEF domain-containing protein [Elusimicrobia bacterium]|nr:GGDEF domain-containing protein [Candidatus Obscuribacterium magneticum]
MNARFRTLRIILLVLAGLVFAAVTASLLVPTPSIPLLFSFYLLSIFAVQALGQGGAAFMMTGFATLFGVFCMTRLPKADFLILPTLMTGLWGGITLLFLHLQRINRQLKAMNDQRVGLAQHQQAIQKEVQFYEGRLTDLGKKGEQRRLLVQAARELGSLLDPRAIRMKLIEKAQILFPQKQVLISYGQTGDPVDTYVLQKKQPLQVPSSSFKGHPLLAVPITAQHAVAGVLRVGSEDPKAAFTRDDLRLLDILASLASLALGNSLLFQHVNEIARRDGLTKLLTHRAFQEKLEEEILEASRFGGSLSLIMADLDHFKAVNDTYGHQAGDQVLVGFSRQLARHVRDIDILARYGGEEFVILLPQMSHMDAYQLAERVRLDIAQQVFTSGSTQFAVTGSFGVATFPEDATSAQQLIRQSDQRLYRAKEFGRNQVRGR